MKPALFLMKNMKMFYLLAGASFLVSGCNTEDLAAVVDTGETDALCQDASGLLSSAQTLLNEARSKARFCGADHFPAVAPIAPHDLIYAAALTHSQDMAAYSFFSHTGSDGSDPGIRLNNAGYIWRTYGENIGAGYISVEKAIEGWLDSPGHCANIMNASVTEFGLACSDSEPIDQYGRYWTLVFAQPAS